MNAPHPDTPRIRRRPRRHRPRLQRSSRTRARAGAGSGCRAACDNNRMLDAWLRINADGTVTVFTGKVELGQGILTALAQIAAEELDVPLARVTMISGDTGRTPERGADRRQPVDRAQRHRAAHGGRRGARACCSTSPAKKLGVAADTLKVADGVINAPDGRKVGYGELAGASRPQARGNRQGDAEAGRAAQDRRQVRSPRLDIPAKVTGGAAFVQDVRLPGMVHGRVVRPPRYGARLDSFDEARMQGDAGRDRGGARRQLSRRRGAARGAGDQGAAGADRVRQVDGRLRAARSGEDVRAAHVAAQPRTR